MLRKCWAGVGGMLTFLALAHMLDATQVLGWGGGDVNVPCTCTHVGCYARCWVGVGGMLTFLALAHMLDATQLAPYQKCIPRSLKNRDPQGYLNQKDLMHVHRWQWRRSCDIDLFTILVKPIKSCADSLRNFCPEKVLSQKCLRLWRNVEH